MLKRLTIAFLLLLLAGCVTHYHVPPQTVVYRDVHGLTSGVYESQPTRVYRGVSGSVSSYVYYPWWSLDYFYLGHGHGYGYGNSFGFSYSSGGPYFGFSWSSAYGYPGPWYGYYYDPWYAPPWRYGWYAPYRHYRGYGHYAWHAPYWRDRYDHYDRYDRYGHRDHDRRDGHWNDARRNAATLDPDWRRREDQRRMWRNEEPGADRAGSRMRGVTGPAQSASHVTMPSSSAEGRSGMTVRSRAGAKYGSTRMHDASSTRPSRESRPVGTEPARAVRYISGTTPSNSTPVSSVRNRHGAKQEPTRAHPARPMAPDRTGSRVNSREGSFSVVSTDRGRAAAVRSAGPGKSRQTRPEAIPIAPAPGRIVTPARSAPPRPVANPPSGWQSSNGAPARSAPSFQSAPRPSPSTGKSSKQVQGSTRPHRSEKGAAGSKRGADRER